MKSCISTYFTPLLGEPLMVEFYCMFYVYILKCGDGNLYTGYTTSIEERFKRHQNKEVFATKGRQPVELIFFEAFQNSGDAKRREMYLKTTAGKRAVELMLRDFFHTPPQSEV